MKLNFYIILFIYFTINSFSQDLKIEKYFEWFEKKFEIHNPIFSHSNNEIAFAKMICFPHEDEMEIHDDYIDSLNAKIKKQNRYADPVVSILNLKTKKLLKIDYGWEPNFSTDDKQIVYTFQSLSIGGSRFLAENFKGNKIKVYNRFTKKNRILASPDSLFFLEPIFIDSMNVIYKIGEHVNGSYGGSIGLEKINLRTKVVEKLYIPQKKFGLYHLIGNIYKYKNSFPFSVYIPQDNGIWMANEYSHLLMNSENIIQDFGIDSYRSLEGKLGIDSNNNIIHLDDDHELRKDTNFLTKYGTNEIIYKKPINFEYYNGTLSPNGKYMLFLNLNSEIYIMDTDNFNSVKLELPNSEIYAITWSENSKKFGIVQSHEKFSNTDIITLFNVK